MTDTIDVAALVERLRMGEGLGAAMAPTAATSRYVLAIMADAATALQSQADALATMEAALEHIVQWSEAYPLKAFPEPDFAKVRELLAAGGIEVGAVSASNMRHVVTKVGAIARAALAKEGK